MRGRSVRGGAGSGPPRRLGRRTYATLGAGLAAALLGACGAGPASPKTSSTLPPAAEPGHAPVPTATPAGTVVSLGAGTFPEGIVADATTGLVAAGQQSPPALDLLDQSGHLVARVALPAGPRHLALEAPGGPVLVPSEKSGRLVKVSIKTKAITAQIHTGVHPHDVAVADGRLFVANEFSNTVTVISGTKVVKDITVPQQPGGIAATGDRVAEISVRARKMDVIDAKTLRTVAVLPVGVGPTHDVGYRNRFYVVDTEGGALLTYSATPTVRLISSAKLAGAPYGMALDPVHARLWVTLTATNRLVAFDLGTGTPKMVASFPTVRQPNTVAVDPTTGNVFVAGNADGVIEVIPPSAQG
ncbi:MAG: YncE family protein [Acidimicrobiales bacterium]